ncbi:hypothetical protein N0V83_000283 [Neocucurbitaria cava]|uniref:Rhodopsin domain-containing protein n=1 Tax=Neocucurbitaria cava TaxID=798079 RepID=A0A9W8YID8_9PLEO|nr:hypothetical protein N0V83_000283 [Neocucurbitaria cava]
MFTSDLIGDPVPNDTRAPMLIGITGSILFIAILLLIARLWSRMRRISDLGLEDWTILATVKYLLVILACAHGFGRRAPFVPYSERSSALHLIFVCQVIWNWSITLVKLSVALLLLRLKPGRAWRIFLFSTMGVLGLNAVVQTFFQFLQCRPFSSYWDPSVFFRGVVKPTLWAMLEQEVALIAASIPTLKSFMQRSLVRIGKFFYDQDTETQVRNRLVELGFLAVGDDAFSSPKLSTGRKPSKPDIQLASFGSPVAQRKWKDEFGDSIDEGRVSGDADLRAVRAGT